MKCETCQAEYKGIISTYFSQIKRIGVNECKKCSCVRAGKKTAAKMSKIYSERWKGENNPNYNPEIRAKITKAAIGRKLSEEHKKALRKPKNKTKKIKEAANRPEEILRRKKRMILNNPSKRKEVREKISKTVSNLYLEGRYDNVNFHSGNFNNKKTKCSIWYRSGLEKEFLEKTEEIDNILFVESAENLQIKYLFNNEIKRYLPDFKITLISGEIIIVEIKSSYFQTFEKWPEKEKALLDFAIKNNYDCVVLNEKEIDQWLEKLKNLKLKKKQKLGI